MTSAEYAADRLRHHMAREHHEAFTGLPWDMLQDYERRMWVRRAEAVLEASSTWRPPDSARATTTT